LKTTRNSLCSLALVLLQAFSPSMAAERVRITEAKVISPSVQQAREASHELAVYIHTFEGTRWSENMIVDALTEAARLVSSCGVALTQLELRTIAAPRRFHFYSTPVSRALLQTLAVPKPALFFVEDTHNHPAFDAEAIGEANATRRPELANTVWIAYGARDLPYALAHELVHVLADSGEHSDEPGNLMRPDTAPGNSRLSAAQCDRVRSQGVAHHLLKPR
jgi:hypothetical protein